MRSAKSDRRAVTPGSVKMLMLVEAAVIAFLSYWVVSEYSSNSYFRTYVDQALVIQVAMYSIAIGVGVGLVGGVATVVYMNLLRAKQRLETIALPKINGAVEKAAPTVPRQGAFSTSTVTTDLPGAQSQVPSSAPRVSVDPVPGLVEEKKRSS